MTPDVFNRDEARLQEQLATDKGVADRLLASDTSVRIAATLSQPYLVTVQEPSAAAMVPRQRLRKAALAGLLGGLAALAVAAATEFLLDRPRDLEGLAKLLGMPVLVTVPHARQANRPTPPENYHLIRQAVGESFHALGTNLRFLGLGGDIKTIVVTSTRAGEGKSMTIACLAATLAQQGKRVIVVDADLRRPSQHRIFGVVSAHGLGSLLLSDADRPATAAPPDEGLLQGTILAQARSTAAFLQRVPVGADAGLATVGLLPCGPVPASPADVLNSEQMVVLLDLLRAAADVVLIDTPPTLVAADTLAVASIKVDGVVFVVDPARTAQRDIVRATNGLQQVGATFLRLAFNNVDPGDDYYKYYANYYTKRTAAGGQR